MTCLVTLMCWYRWDGQTNTETDAIKDIKIECVTGQHYFFASDWSPVSVGLSVGLSFCREISLFVFIHSLLDNVLMVGKRGWGPPFHGESPVKKRWWWWSHERIILESTREGQRLRTNDTNSLLDTLVWSPDNDSKHNIKTVHSCMETFEAFKQHSVSRI